MFRSSGPVSDIPAVLSLLGALRERTSMTELERFVWLADADGEQQARAAELLVWVSRGAQLERVRRIMYEHPDARVRLAAIDACVFASGDDPRMLGGLRELARVQECLAARPA
ncbi:hypothetical protein ACFVUS_11605 [Nocardia sp. NPDC058058]|uniref:hypothetical protein n=1 Tax=Nocardia sp. NPDC058058 TaxID=3346317 RepID=UPI0036D83040